MALKLNIDKTKDIQEKSSFSETDSFDLQMPDLEEAEAMVMDECSSAFSDDLLTDDFSQLDLDEPNEVSSEVLTEDDYEEMEDYYTEAYPEFVAKTPVLEEKKPETILTTETKEDNAIQKGTKEKNMTFAERLKAINAQKEIAFKEEIEAEIERIKAEIESMVMEKNIEQYTLNTKDYEPRKKTWILTGLTTEGLVVIPNNDDSVILKWI